MKRIVLSLFALSLLSASAQENVLRVDLSSPGKAISPDLIGIFFEDINYSADGGLYAELVQNRSFEYNAKEQLAWGPLTAWDFVTRNGGKGSVKIADQFPVHPNNPTYVVIENEKTEGSAGVVNSGFDGIVVKAGEQYDFSMFGRQLFVGPHWGGDGKISQPAKFLVRLESKSGALLAETSVEISGRDWQRVAATLAPTNSDPDARLAVLSVTRGGVALDEISLFPHATFRGRANGLRADLAQTIAELHPKFMRFPGGCLVHGIGLNNFYRWKDSIGPIEQRRGQPNLWGYHQSVGLGYFEYFQFCEDIGAKPLPVVPAGVCCQNADHQGGTGQRGLPLAEMPAYIQEILDLIEWANGPTNSVWGAKRAAAGHPAPFGLQYLGVGNEENITPVFEERFKLIHDVLRAKHPEITFIGTTGPFHSGDDYDAGWKFANAERVAMVDEHYYEKPEWFLNNLTRYDAYDRTKSKVYVGEYASKGNALANALAEAAYLTALERNADVVRLASYAPMLAKSGHTQWRPDIIYFDNTRVLRSANYFVQQLFGQNSGDEYLAATIAAAPETLATSCVRDSKSGDVILKLVNNATNAVTVNSELPGANKFKSATRTVLTGEVMAVNSFDKPARVAPVSVPFAVKESFTCELPAHSLTVIRLCR